MTDTPEILRLIGDLIRIGTVAEVDLTAARCTVKVGEILTPPLPWLAPRAGSARSWSPPSVGEQVVLLCPEADTALGIVLTGLFSDHNAAPASEDMTLLAFKDGAQLAYDPAAHRLSAVLPSGGTAVLKAPGGVEIEGDVTITGTVSVTGKLEASEDVTAAGISLKTHVHGKVTAGTAVSGAPQ